MTDPRAQKSLSGYVHPAPAFEPNCRPASAVEVIAPCLREIRSRLSPTETVECTHKIAGGFSRGVLQPRFACAIRAPVCPWRVTGRADSDAAAVNQARVAALTGICSRCLLFGPPELISH